MRFVPPDCFGSAFTVLLVAGGLTPGLCGLELPYVPLAILPLVVFISPFPIPDLVK